MGFFQSVNEFVFGPVPTIAASYPFPLEPDRRTVLVVDDDTALLDSVQFLLHDAGYNVLKTDRGVKSLEVLDFIPRDIGVVLLDYSMPELDGDHTLTLLRKINPRVKVIAFTGMAPDRLPESFRKGVDAIITKPFRSNDLIESINFLLGEPTPV